MGVRLGIWAKIRGVARRKDNSENILKTTLVNEDVIEIDHSILLSSNNSSPHENDGNHTMQEEINVPISTDSSNRTVGVQFEQECDVQEYFQPSKAARKAVSEPEKNYKQLLPTSEMKKRDLVKLCKNNVIPVRFHDEFFKLKYELAETDADDDNEDESSKT
ncbi:unnamed protein product [Acanthoscelides obtectus]|uniref:Uncharacterized protein n=1 Tax=Acanthoscelides obtectus TaxID=200917 RepID=A0A9P0JRT5_ACAOB|nr:unnamed protein product [Acanthoscelides obtectus]CAK1668965.1 hypothetical protein AOBTE_LOCUS26709 [Acanthoscelides obtectus]